MKIVDKITVSELKEMAAGMYGTMVNLRPRQNNLSRDVQDPGIRKKIIDLVESIVHE